MDREGAGVSRLVKCDQCERTTDEERGIKGWYELRRYIDRTAEAHLCSLDCLSEYVASIKAGANGGPGVWFPT